MKLLIVEDEIQLLKSLEDFASEEFYFYDFVSTLEGALERVALYDYDCIVLDMNLPDGIGFELLKILYQKEESHGTIIIFGTRCIRRQLKGLGLGADDYLTKPLYFSELNARIKAIIRRKQFKTNKSVNFANLVIDPNQHLLD